MWDTHTHVCAMNIFLFFFLVSIFCNHGIRSTMAGQQTNGTARGRLRIVSFTTDTTRGNLFEFYFKSCSNCLCFGVSDV
ncbi:hypothetical protein B0T17DRAFT_542771 [Bombardia bombarda]|uniref:Secreted protein n=1 Tax=Bombardia bombarda TaxID=252184 RepID=A0AA39TQ94_9PEZI|nr:hypothetical protein B0T17DRAFT_542771 [Bombardia bombarda]